MIRPLTRGHDNSKHVWHYVQCVVQSIFTYLKHVTLARILGSYLNPKILCCSRGHSSYCCYSNDTKKPIKSKQLSNFAAQAGDKTFDSSVLCNSGVKIHNRNEHWFSTVRQVKLKSTWMTACENTEPSCGRVPAFHFSCHNLTR